MLNSRNYQSDKEVINSGESIAPESNLQDPNVKVYYHQVPGAITHLPDGAQLQFLGGQFATGNDEIKAYLDKIADKKGSMVFTKKTVGVNPEVALAASAAAAPSGDAKVTLDTPKVDADIVAAMSQGAKQELTPSQQAEVRAQLAPVVTPGVLKAGVIPVVSK